MQPESAPSTTPLVRAIEARRERLQSQAAGHRARIDEIEARLLDHLDRVTEQLAAERESLSQRQSDYERLLRELELRQLGQKERGAELDRWAADLERRSAELTYLEETLARRDAELQRFAGECQIEAQRRRETLEQREAECLRREAEFERVTTAQAAEREGAARRQAAADQALSRRVVELDDRHAALEALAAQIHEQQQTVLADRQRVTDELSAAQDAERAALVARSEAERVLAERKTNIDARQAEIEAEFVRRQTEMEAKFASKQVKLAAECDARQAELDSLAARLQRDEKLAAAERDNALNELAQLKKRAEERLALLAQGQAELAEDQERTHQQRRHLAEQMRRQRDALREESAQRLAEIHAMSAETNFGQETLLQDARRECERMGERLRARDEELAAELAAHHEARAELARLSVQIEQSNRESAVAQQQIADTVAESDSLRAQAANLAAECALLREQLEDHSAAAATSAADAELREMVANLAAERDQLVRRLGVLEGELAAAREAAPATADAERGHELVDLTQRYEMAVRDIRELKKQNEELARKSTNTAAVPLPTGGALDWEARKRQLLASLEEDEGSADEERRGEILRMEEVVRTTDAEIQERDRQIEELRRQLAEGAAAATAITENKAAETNELLDKDELVRQERERLKQLEAEWENKLRQAEIDLSMQRAKLARGQAELSERQRALEELGSARDTRTPNDAGSKSKKAPRGRWLSRLGLSDDEKS